MIGYLLIALAPLWPAANAEAEPEEGPIELWQLALPWLAVLAVAITAIWLAVLDLQLDRFLKVVAGGIGVLLVASQVLSHRDSLSLLVKRQTAEAELERRNRTLNEVAAHAPLGIARVGPDMNVIDVNPRLAGMLRTEPSKMVGTPDQPDR